MSVRRSSATNCQLPIFLEDIQVHLKSRQHLFGIRRISPICAQTRHPLALFINVTLSFCNAAVGFSQIVILGWHGLGPLSSSDGTSAYEHALGGSTRRKDDGLVLELVDLRWDQVDFRTGSLHVRRVKKGTPSTHPSLTWGGSGQGGHHAFGSPNLTDCSYKSPSLTTTKHHKKPVPVINNLINGAEVAYPLDAAKIILCTD
jgi:hypothetical protein